MSKKQENTSESKPRRGRPRKAKVAEPNGVGDKVEKVLNSKVVKPVTDALKKLLWKDGEDCGCEERKQKLNKKFRKKRNVRCVNEEQHSYLKAVLPHIHGSLDKSTMNELARIHAAVFNYHFEGACSSCASRNRKIIEELRGVMETYKPE